MSTLLRLSAPNLAGVIAIALAPLFIVGVQPRPAAAPVSAILVEDLVGPTNARAGSQGAALAEPNVAEQVAAIQ
jgi:hypothetical protein